MTFPLVGLVLCGLSALPQDAPRPEVGYVWQPAFAVDTLRRSPATPYVPQPGDLMICNSRQTLWRATYRLVLTSPPTHTALFFRKPDGQMAVVETWVYYPWNVEIRTIDQRLSEYDGDLYVRRRKTPLTDEASARLTEFALAAEGKRIGAVRLFGQATPLRTRGPVRTAYVGKPAGFRDSYFCSELVTEALVYAGLLDANVARPSATYPHDLFFDYSTNPFLNRYFVPAVSAGWEPPAYWTKEK